MRPVSPARQRFAALMQEPDGEIFLDLAALLVAQEEYPDLEPLSYLNRLEFMALTVRRHVPEGGDAMATVAALNHYLFDEEGFRGNDEQYYDPRNSYLNQVLDRRTGIPITLSIIYIEVARRLGLCLHGVGMPGHFLVRYDGPTPDHEPLLIDPFERGALLTPADCRRRFMDGPRRPRLDLEFLAPVDTRYILARMLTNLKSLYLSQLDYGRALAASERILLARPDDLSELRDCAQIKIQQGLLGDALWDLERYLVLFPAAPDTSSLRDQAHTIWQRLALLN